MNRAEQMKKLADEVVEKKQGDAKEVAAGLVDVVLDFVDGEAKKGRYSAVYSYGGAMWREVVEALGQLLVDEGFRYGVSNANLEIYWNDPLSEKFIADRKKDRVEEM